MILTWRLSWIRAALMQVLYFLLPFLDSSNLFLVPGGDFSIGSTEQESWGDWRPLPKDSRSQIVEASILPPSAFMSHFTDTDFYQQVLGTNSELSHMNCDWTFDHGTGFSEWQSDILIDNNTSSNDSELRDRPCLQEASILCNELQPNPYPARSHLQPSRRWHPLYHNVIPKADGLYHCPFEDDPTANCMHKPQKLKCNYEYNLVFSFSLS